MEDLVSVRPGVPEHRMHILKFVDAISLKTVFSRCFRALKGVSLSLQFTSNKVGFGCYIELWLKAKSEEIE